jgi:hypothetical protein
VKFLRLSVKCFRGIAEAHIDFEPGLNILFGPNEAGKSTLAEALRAALLCRSQSSVAEAYLPAIGPGSPEVSLTFSQPDGEWYRIGKTFGDRPSTSLERSPNQGQTFVREANGDGAETELRKRLRWGLRAPGGRGATRGVESTFLTRTLLAEQTEVDTIFQQGLEPESTEQATFVQEALAAALEDPRFKRALTLAHQHFKRYFTSNGNKTRGANSPWTRAKDQLNEAQTELDAARRVAEEVAALQRTLLLAQDEAAEAAQMLEAAKAERRTLDKTLQAAEHRKLLIQELEVARADMDHALTAQHAVDSLRVRINELKQTLEAKTAEVDTATTTHRTAREQREVAQTMLQCIESADGNAQRELEVARVEFQLTALRHELDELNRRMADANALAIEERKLGELRARIEAEKVALTESRDLEAKASSQIARLRLERTAALVRDADSRLHTAVDRFSSAAEGVQAAQAAAEQAEAKGVEELELRSRVLTYGDLSADQIDLVQRLFHDLDKRRSAIEAGLSVTLERLQTLEVGARIDDQTAIHHPSSTGRVQVEAKRRVELDLGGLAKLQITAGSSTARAELAAAEVVWAQNGQIVLQQHGVDSVEALQRRLRERMEAERQLQDIRRECGDLSARAQRLTSAQEALAQAQIEAKEAEAARFELPPCADAIPAASVREIEAQLIELQDKARKAELAGIAVEATLRQLGESERDKATQIAEQQRVLREPGLELLTRGHARLAAIEEEAKSLTITRGELKEGLQKALRAAQEAASKAKEALDAAERRQQSLGEERLGIDRELEMNRGRLTSEAEHLASLDIEGRTQCFTNCQAKIDAHPPVVIDPGAVEVADARIYERERQVEEAKRRVISGESRIASSEGAIAQERLEEAESAYEVANADYEANRTDGEASKLLLETLKEAEASSTRHVGTAIGGKVQARFAELTRHRYRGLSVDKALVAQKVQLGEAVLGPGQLSVGTRHQLAILLRLILAEQLGHPIVLDDQLVQSDPERLEWFREQLAESGSRTQIIVLSCRPADYRSPHGSNGANLIDVSTHVKLRLERYPHDAA